jgi:chromosomal replication initiator protein
VREIEGAVAKLAAVSVLDTRRLQGEAINESSVTQVLDADAARERRTNVRIPTIIDAACEALGVERSECLGASRHRRAVLARGVIALLAREFTTRSYPEIAKAMGRSTHSTIHAAASRVQKLVEQRSAIDAADGSCGADELVARVRRSVLAAPRS